MPYVDITLKGPPKNINALGAKIILFAGGGIRTYEKYPVRGFPVQQRDPDSHRSGKDTDRFHIPGLAR